MNSKLRSQIASLPDRDNVVYEIYEDSNQVAEISNEQGEGLRVEIFNCPNGSWCFDYTEFQGLLEQAKKNIA